MLRAGLTGSIAVGKSFVSSVFAELGAHVLDADQTAREVVAPGSAGLRAIVETFGVEVLQPDGTLDRAKLGAIVFNDETKRERLNAILHPRIIEAQNEWLRQCEAQDPRGVAIVDAALMIESGSYRRFDKLIVVHCRSELQLERLVKRDGLTMAEATRRICSQMPQEEKKGYADYLIDTSAGFEDARRQTSAVYESLRALAAVESPPGN
ncbi:MAG TPA: dephospho-CoA kinase [Pyrinomonadaceae bacterium]|nr:dephospho-CoA kinase [Pyrinomonadaceae bacterium]